MLYDGTDHDSGDDKHDNDDDHTEDERAVSTARPTSPSLKEPTSPRNIAPPNNILRSLYALPAQQRHNLVMVWWESIVGNYERTSSCSQGYRTSHVGYFPSFLDAYQNAPAANASMPFNVGHVPFLFPIWVRRDLKPLVPANEPVQQRCNKNRGHNRARIVEVLRRNR